MAESKDLPARPRSTRFQTAAAGTYVHTAVDAHFDPYNNGDTRPRMSLEEMEKVERVRVPA